MGPDVREETGRDVDGDRVTSADVPADRPIEARAAKVGIVRPTYITWVTLAFMTTASVASLRSAPTMAVYGLTAVFLYIVPAIVFLLPQSLVAASSPPAGKAACSAG